MPTGKNWFYYIFVNLAFVGFIIGMYFISSMADIKKNWATYRCNPIYMPLASNIEQNFTYCMQNITSGFMGSLLQPLTYVTSTISSSMSSFSSDINGIRGMFSKIRTSMSNVFESIYAVFLNLIIEFQKIILGIKDLFGKTVGILTTLMYVLDGSIMTMNSAWNGPAGKMVRVLSKCFHPNTKLTLKNGNIVFMKDVQLGDVLQNGSKVYGVLKIANYDNENLYMLQGNGVNGENIYVTGSHIIYDSCLNKFVQVKNYEKCKKQDKVTSDFFSCLITSDHTIPIGSELFWDWEDDDIFKKINSNNYAQQWK